MNDGAGLTDAHEKEKRHSSRKAVYRTSFGLSGGYSGAPHDFQRQDQQNPSGTSSGAPPSRRENTGEIQRDPHRSMSA